MSFVRTATVLAAVLPSVATAAAQSLTAEDLLRLEEAERRRGAHYAERLSMFIREAPLVEPGGTVFVGDSISEGFPLRQVFPGQNMVNRGIGGDRVEGVLERVDVSVERVRPRRIFLKIGINNIVHGLPASDEQLSEHYERLVDAIRAAAPSAELIIQTTLPLAERAGRHNGRVRRYVAHVRRVAEARGLRVVDLHTKMADERGNLRDEYTTDSIHLNLRGYEAWMEMILTPREFFDACVALAPAWRRMRVPHHPIAAVDPGFAEDRPGGRGQHDLVMYTERLRRRTTGTDEWGMEALVRGGVVVDVIGLDAPRPVEGFILSAGGRAAPWLSANLMPGVRVSLDHGEARWHRGPAWGRGNARWRLTAALDRFFEVLPLATRDAAAERLARGIAAEIQRLRNHEQGARDEEIAALESDLARLERMAAE